MADTERNKKYGLIAGGVLVLLVLGFVFGGSSVPDFKDYEAGTERKDAFFGYFLPIIQEENAKITETREELLAWYDDQDSIGWWDEGTIEDIAADYGIGNGLANDPLDHSGAAARRLGCDGSGTRGGAGV